MRKTIVFSLFTVFAISANASVKREPVLVSAITKEFKNLSEANDTLQTPSSLENSILSFQNLIFKRRLDSLHSTVSFPYNEYVQHYIDIYLSRKEQIGKMLGLSEYYFPIFEKALQEAGIPDEIKFITVVESALNPNAVSKSGAVGPWQFMYTTAKGYGLVMDNYTDERKDPVKASYAAAHYLQNAYERIGDWLLTIAAFNCGTGAVTRAIAKSGGVADFWKVRPFLPRETQNYVPAFIATAYAMNYYKNHEITVQPAGFNILTDLVPVNKRISISSIATAANLDLNELLILNPSYIKQIINGSPDLPKPLVIPAVNNKVYASLYDLFNGVPAETSPVMINSAIKRHFEPKSDLAEFHNVKSGQNLSNIAEMHGVEVQDLKVWNNLKSFTIVPGQSIRISPSAKPTPEKKDSGYFNYVVKAGDTLSDIADKFEGVTVSKIKALNGLTKSIISPGMLLKIGKS